MLYKIPVVIDQTPKVMPVDRTYQPRNFALLVLIAPDFGAVDLCHDFSVVIELDKLVSLIGIIRIYFIMHL